MKYEILILWLSFKWIFKINLGDEVKYQGSVYQVANGVRPGKWRLSGLNNDDHNKSWADRGECKKVWSFKNIKRSFLSGMNFYKTNWLDMWKREGIKPWMKKCNIW